MPCASVSSSVFGKPSSAAYACGSGSVLVGFDVAYDPPPADLSRNGSVRGATAYYCAPAADVASAASGRAGSVTLARAQLPSAAATTAASTSANIPKLATFMCPAGEALAGANAWQSSAGALERVQFQCARFAPGAPMSAVSSWFPAETGASSAAKVVRISTAGNAPSAQFADGFSQSDGVGAMTALGFDCQDYSNALSASEKDSLACCAGAAGAAGACGGMQPQSDACDSFMAAYCARDCASGSCSTAACACFGSPAAAPQCHDSRCANGAAYQTARMRASACDDTPPSCETWNLLGDGKNLAAGVVPPAGCESSSHKYSYPKIIAIVLFILALLFVAFSMGGGRKKTMSLEIPPPPPPADLF